MNYFEFSFTVSQTEDFQQDLLIYALGEVGFDTFEETDFGFKAYIPVIDFNQEGFEDVLSSHKDMFSFSYEKELIPQKNWNELWESNFNPIQIGDKIYVRATFHQAQPKYPYEIVIDPKMAFGTGHHQTTSMMLELMLETDFGKKKVLDMGCGTGILAIMASKLGASEITAIDNDPICFNSTLENSKLNNIINIETLCGSKEIIPERKYDVIIANINRNILLDQLENYNRALANEGELFLSGFYELPDLEIIKNAAANYGIKYVGHKKTNDWVAAKFVK